MGSATGASSEVAVPNGTEFLQAKPTSQFTIDVTVNLWPRIRRLEVRALPSARRG